MEQAHHGAQAELPFEPEPDVEHHQADRDQQGQDAADKELAGNLRPHDFLTGELDVLAERALKGLARLLDRHRALNVLRRLETDHGVIAPAGVRRRAVVLDLHVLATLGA